MVEEGFVSGIRVVDVWLPGTNDIYVIDPKY